jgi:hypothetical protein
MQTLPIDKLGKTIRRQVFGYKRPVYLWGPSGIGKSYETYAEAKAYAKELGRIFFEIKFSKEFGCVNRIPKGADPDDYFGFLDLRAVMCDVLDAKGAPYIDQGDGDAMTRFARASFLPDVERHGSMGYWFWDEFAQAPPSVSNSLTQALYDRRIGDNWVMPDGWGILAAGNRKEDQAATQRAGLHVYNRFCHYEVTTTPQALANYLIGNGYDVRIAQFCLFKQDLINKFEKGDIVFPTSRSMESLSVIVTDAPKWGLSKGELQSDCAAHVGVALAAEVVSFLDICDQITPYRDIVADPDNAKLPEAGHGGATAARFAVMGNILNQINHADLPFWKRCAHLDEEACIQEWRSRHPNITTV